MPPPSSTRWRLPGSASSSNLVVWRNDAAAAQTNKRPLQDIDLAPPGDNSGRRSLSGIPDAQLRNRLTRAFEQRKRAALELPRTGPGAASLDKMGRPLESEQLHSTLALEELHSLITSMDNAEFLAWFKMIFGEDIPQTAFVQLRAAVLGGKLPVPAIVIVSGGIEGHVAAYNRKERTILIARELVRAAREDNNQAWELLVCLTEEFGHHLDNLLRTHYSSAGGDAPLDEGARVAYSLIDFGWERGRKHREFAVHSTPEGRVALKVEYAGMTTAVQQFLSTEDQQDDVKWEDLEFFGAGRGSGRKGSYGHESIEDALEQANFTPLARKHVYFGNWLRDHSQLIDPKVTRKPKASVTTGFSREALTAIVDILARAKFGDSPEFYVTTQRLGVYRNEEHIDNPYGITDGRSIDPAFRGACTSEELAVSPTLRMKNFIRSGSVTTAGPSRLHRVRDGDTLDSLARANGLTWQELARYNFGTDDKDELSRQLYSKVGCRKRTADGHSYVFTSKDVPGLIKIPTSTGGRSPERPYTAFHYLAGQLQMAAKRGKTLDGYRHFGHALHTLEDFFSHTNFVELALIHLGAWVVPWVPAGAARAGNAQPLTLTSGKFGGLDTVASLTLGVAEQLQKQQECIAGELTTGSKIALILLRDQGYHETHATMGGLLKKLHELEKKYPKLATLSCETVGMVMRGIQFMLGKIVHTVAGSIDDAQTLFLQDPKSDNPTHTQLAKDHDDHPLHALAAELAAGAVRDVGKAMQRAWRGEASADEVVRTAARYMLHPTQIDAGGSAGWMLEKVRLWIPGHRDEIKRLGSKTWVEYWTKESSKHLKEMRKRADKVMGRSGK